MSCPICAAAGYDHAKLRKMCLESPFWVGRILCKFDRLDGQLHFALSNWYTKKLAEGRRRFLILTPRDHLKTTLFGISNIIWRIINNPEERVLYVMSTTENAEEKLSVVKDVLTDPHGALAHLFPEAFVGDPETLPKWRQEAIQLPRHGKYPDPTVKAVGVGSSLVGGHFTWHIFDDLIDEKRSQSAVEQEKVIEFVRRSGPLFVNRNKDVRLIIGTYWDGPFYKWLVEEAEFIKYYEQLIFGCYADDRYFSFMQDIGMPTTVEPGDPIWPAQFDHESLKEERIEAGEANFSRQWLNIPVADAMRRFHREDFRQYTPERSGWEGVMDSGDRVDFSSPEFYRSMTIDPSSGEGNDSSAITVCAFSKVTGRIFVLESWEANVLPHGLIDKIFYFQEKWRPHVVSPEESAFQVTFKHFLREEMKRRGIGFFIKPITHGGKSKAVRILDGLQPFIKRGMVYVKKENRNLVDQLCNLMVFQGKIVGASPNLADSFAYHVGYWVTRKDENEDLSVYGTSFVHALDNYPSYGIACST